MVNIIGIKPAPGCHVSNIKKVGAILSEPRRGIHILAANSELSGHFVENSGLNRNG